MKKYLLLPVVMALLVSLVTGCTIHGTTSEKSQSTQPVVEASTATGSVEIMVTDAPRDDDVSAIWIKVKEVQIHKAGTNQNDGDDDSEWITANITGPNPFELLALKNGGIQSLLGDAHLASGNYTQIRMVVESVQVTIAGDNKTAEVPSGKLKFVHPFEVKPDQTTVLLFDFDAAKSVIVNKNKIIVKPVVKLTSEKPQPGKPDNSGQLVITPTALPNGMIGVPYNATLTATKGTVPYSWALLSGSLPAGLNVDNTTSSINGTPTTHGTYTFTIGVSDNSTVVKNGSRQYSLTIAAAGDILIATTTLPNASRAAYYEHSLQALGGSGSYNWTFTGDFPVGLALSVGGIISGTTTADLGTHTFTIKATDTADITKFDTQELTITVIP